MDLGEKILQQRKAAGLSQRQLCGDRITRNMLSQIEHGTARPSMDTLRYLAEQLGKPLSFFLDEEGCVSPNQSLMEQVRKAEPGRESLMLLRSFREPDELFSFERGYRMGISLMAAAQQALEQGKSLYARQLLEEAKTFTGEFPELERSRLLILGKIPGADLTQAVSGLPGLDEELLLRAEAALEQAMAERALALLGAVEDQNAPQWQLLQGKTRMQMKQFSAAADCLEKAREAFPGECVPALEVCWRELGDYQKAYHYACLQRQVSFP